MVSLSYLLIVLLFIYSFIIKINTFKILDFFNDTSSEMESLKYLFYRHFDAIYSNKALRNLLISNPKSRITSKYP